MPATGPCFRCSRGRSRRVFHRSLRSPCPGKDRKSTRLNSSHANISYAVFCLKKNYPPPPAFPAGSLLSPPRPPHLIRLSPPSPLPPSPLLSRSRPRLPPAHLRCLTVGRRCRP